MQHGRRYGSVLVVSGPITDLRRVRDELQLLLRRQVGRVRDVQVVGVIVHALVEAAHGKEGWREGGSERGREREGGMDRERGRDGERERGRDGEREREGWRERGRE